MKYRYLGSSGLLVSRKHVIASCEASLKRLQTDYIDLYYIHGPDPVSPLEETMRALEEQTRPEEEYLTWRFAFKYQRHWASLDDGSIVPLTKNATLTVTRREKLN